MLSKKTKYSLLALLRLARDYGQGPLLISEIAEEEGIPKKFLEAILLDFKNHGILQSKKGKNGGYLLSRDPATIRLSEVIRIMEGPLAPMPCVSETAYAKCTECKDETICGIRLVMQDVRDAMVGVLDRISLADLLKRTQQMIARSQGEFIYEI